MNIPLPSRYVPTGSWFSGGFGKAVVCKDQDLDRDVVIKEILDPQQIPRIIDEVVALQAAKSKHVVEIYDVLIAPNDDGLAIVEEYLPGSDLTTLTYNKSTPMQFYRIAYQIARGIAEIHERNIVHRDIKPNNMKFDSENYVKIFDFGLAKVSSLPASTKALIGTPGFMAPELFALPSVIDKPVDVYAFGVMMFIFVTGKLPICASPGMAPPSALPPQGSISLAGFNCPRVASLVDTCLELNPSQRPTMRTICKALEGEILYGKHRATLVSSTATLILDINNSKVKAAHNANSIEIAYNGYEFIITAVTGFVFINNRQAQISQILNGAQVITLGNFGVRKFATFDVSHPEVEL